MKAITDAVGVREMEALLTRRHERFGMLWRLGVITGLRISDLLKLRVKDVSGLEITVVESKTRKVKTVKFDVATWMCLDWFVKGYGLRDSDYLFYRRDNRRDIPMSRQWARTVIARTAREMGLELIGAHSLRKIYACLVYRSSGSLNAARDALNHSKVETTLLYLRDLDDR